MTVNVKKIYQIELNADEYRILITALEEANSEEANEMSDTIKSQVFKQQELAVEAMKKKHMRVE